MQHLNFFVISKIASDFSVGKNVGYVSLASEVVICTGEHDHVKLNKELSFSKHL